MRSTWMLALGALALAGCAAAPRPTISAAEAFGAKPEARAPAGADGEPTARTEDVRRLPPPDRWARGFKRPGDCESGARAVGEDGGRELGWTYLKACTARRDFGLLNRLLDNWTPELKGRPEAATVLAGVLANRGGLIKSDLATLQSRRLPFFELSAALRQPEAFRGRYLVFVGRVEKVKSAKGRTEMVLAETGRVDEDTTVFGSTSYGSVSSRSSTLTGKGSYETSAYGSGKAEGSATYNSQSASRSGALERRGITSFEDTGQRIITRMTAPDPFLSVDRNLLFLVRFDGARTLVDDTAEDEEPKLTALVSLISYHDVAAVGALDQ